MLSKRQILLQKIQKASTNERIVEKTAPDECFNTMTSKRENFCCLNAKVDGKDHTEMRFLKVVVDSVELNIHEWVPPSERVNFRRRV